MSFPDYLIGTVRNRNKQSSGSPKEASPSKNHTGSGNKQPVSLNRSVSHSSRPVSPSSRPVGPSNRPVGPVAPESFGSKAGRAFSGLMGFVPKGGTRGDAADGFANIGRALMGLNSVQQMESDYNDSVAPEQLRRALATGDIEAIKRLDPDSAARVQGVDKNTYNQGRQKSLDDAIAGGNFADVARIDPETGNVIENQNFKRDNEKLVGAGRAVQALQSIIQSNPGNKEQAVKKFLEQNPDTFTQSQMDAYNQGGIPALSAMVGGGGALSGKDRYLSVGGGLYDMNDGKWIESPVQDLTDKERAEISLLEARTGQANRSNRPKGSGSEGKTGGFSDPAVVKSYVENFKSALGRAKQAGAVRGGKELNFTERAISAAMAAPGGMEDPGVAAAYAAMFPDRFTALQDIRSATVPLVQALRTLPGLDAARLADTPKELELLVSIVANPNSSAKQIDSSISSFLSLFDSTIAKAGAPAGSNAGAQDGAQDGTRFAKNAKGERIKSVNGAPWEAVE